MKKYKLAVVGVTGVVGGTFLKILEAYKLPISRYGFFASARSAGKKITFMGEEHTVQELTENSFDDGYDVALFSAGGGISERFAPIAAEKGCVVIDNSSFWRMDNTVPLVVPEVNPEALKNHNNIIANPNCSTTQAMLPLKAIQDAFGIKRVVFSTYQSVSGAGHGGNEELESQINAYVNNEPIVAKQFAHPIFNNCLPHIDDFTDDGYTKEEHKMIDETRKILSDDAMRITATTVRVPVFCSHSESINIETKEAFEIDDVKAALANFSDAMVLIDNVANNKYPLATDATGKNEVFVGRVRRDNSVENGINLWCVSDNLRKGAATNTVQIARYMMQHDLI